MKRLFSRLAPGLLAILAAGCATRPPPDPVTVPEVVEMTRSNVPPAAIIAAMKASETVYRLQASQLAELSRQGVAPEVLDYMQGTYLEAVRRDAYYDDWRTWSRHGDFWYGGPYYGWPRERVIVIREPPQPPPPPPPRRKKR